MLHIKKWSRKQRSLFFALSALATAVIIVSCLYFSDSRRFQILAEDLFASELSGNMLNLHYTLAYPEKYGLSGEALLPSYEPGSEENDGSEAVRSTLEQLSKIDSRRLDEDNAYTYELLNRYLTIHLSGSSFSYYNEPLSPSSGMQSGLPILLADYTFRSPKDVEDYLHILDQTDTYFGGLVQYEKEKSQQGLFMSDSAAADVIEQCYSIMDKDALASGTHFLHTTFVERLDSLEKEGIISKSQKEQWISENDRLLTTVMAPAYENMADAFTVLQGSGVNDKGLYYFPEGRAYYEYLLASTTGSSRSISEIKTLLFDDFRKNFAAMAALLEQFPQLTTMIAANDETFPYSTPEEMLEDLKARMAADFPSFPESEENSRICYTIKSVSPSMEDYCSPAYYLTPPIDDMTDNIIYINHKNSPDALTLYTTLAHEGYPGHLYQTVYSQLYMNRQDTSCIRYLLHYGGYVEGWALYVENLSYEYAQALVQDPLTAAWYEACRLNRNIQLCLYSLLDIAIHYEGATPAKAAAILRKVGITEPQTVSAIYDYIVEEPTNYLKYYLGFLEFLSLKDRTRELWGAAFSLPLFHQYILETGPSDFQGLDDKERLLRFIKQFQ